MSTNNNGVKNNRGLLSNLWIGLALIAGGTIVLLNQMGVWSFEFNWWALFILFPAFGALNGAYNRYRSTNDLFEMGVMVPALVGMFMLMLLVSMLFGEALNMNLKVYWPIILIVLGLGLIIGNRQRHNNE